MSIAPLKNSPLQRTVNRILADIQVELPGCRQRWWITKQTTCLANQWAIMLTPERVELSPGPAANAKQITDATYDLDQERLQITFQNSTTANVSTRP